MNDILKSKQQSIQILGNKYEKVKYEIFKLLDTNKTGIISAEKIDIEKIPTFLLKILSPLLFELEDKNQFLNFDEFSMCINRLFETLNFKDKNAFINGTQKHITTKIDNYRIEETFQPKLCRKSVEIAREMQTCPASFGGQIFHLHQLLVDQGFEG